MKPVLFWDFDGTLVYRNHSFLDALEQALREYQNPLPQDACKRFLQEACSWNHAEKSYSEQTGELWWVQLLAQLNDFLTEQHIPAEYRTKICRKFREFVITYPYRLYEDAVEALSEAREKGYVNALLSNNFPELVQTVEALGLRPLLEQVFLSSNLGYEKPRKELFQIALEQMGNPKIAYMIGDHPKADMEGAAKAGLHTILVHGESKIPQAEYCCSSLRELSAIL